MPMPESRWGKALTFIYIAGYFLFLIVAGANTWSELSFADWRNYMAFQFIYAAFWPILLILSVAGWRW